MKGKIIFEDAHILVCYKPSGLATQTARIGQQDFVSELKNHLDSPYLGIIHRLDQPVEGLLLFSKTKKVAGILTHQLRNRTLHKHYYAVLCGQPIAKSGQLVDNLIKDNKLGFAKVVTYEEPLPREAKRAVLRYSILEELSLPMPLALADIEIETGRFHQIRAQMSYAGLPLYGDRKYGKGTVAMTDIPSVEKQLALCAYSLQFTHPIERKSMSFQITPQGDIFHLFSQFGERKEESNILS